MLSEICTTILSLLSNLPGQPRTQVTHVDMHDAYVNVQFSHLHLIMPLPHTHTYIHTYTHTHTYTGRFPHLRLIIPLLQPQEHTQRASNASRPRSGRPFPPSSVGASGQFG